MIEKVRNMKSSHIIKNKLRNYNQNELIFASKLFREKLESMLNEAAYYKMLERMCQSGELAKAAKGIYYIPAFSKYGLVPLSDEQIISAFTENETGMVIGYSLYNSYNLTTQISKNINILSSSLEGLSKTIKNVQIKQLSIDFTIEVRNMISALEILQNFYNIEDLNYTTFIEYSKTIADNFQEEVFETVLSKTHYKKSTISFLKDILDYYEISHHLNKHLSSLSKYKNPKMEELYAIAQSSGRI